MLRVIIPIVIAVAIIIGCVIYLSQDNSINNGTEDILYNDIVYERVEMPNYNLELSEKNATYIGDFNETYAYGQEFPYEVYTINGDANVLSSAHATWIKPGYVFPGEFGEDFASVEYVVADGLNFFMMLDAYTEEVTHLSTFTDVVRLEDIVATEASDITEFTEHNIIRFHYKDHQDMYLQYTLCSHEGKYYLNILQGQEGTNALFEIKSEYVALLTSAIPQAK